MEQKISPQNNSLKNQMIDRFFHQVAEIIALVYNYSNKSKILHNFKWNNKNKKGIWPNWKKKNYQIPVWDTMVYYSTIKKMLELFLEFFVYFATVFVYFCY